MKKNFLKVFSLMLMGFAIVSCSSPAKMAKNAELVSVESNPQVLEVVANEIEAAYTINFPEGYFHPKATLQVVPVLVYQGGEILGAPLMLQGEKVTDNHKVVANAGAQVNGKVKFDYVKGVEKSYLELRFAVLSKDKIIEFPVAYKLADGANTTYMLVNTNGTPAFAPHAYKKILKETREAQILYLINNATVRPSQLRSDEIKSFQEFLAEIENDERRTIQSTNIVAYASPDGELDFNTELSEKRAKTATDAFAKITKKTPVDAPVDSRSVSEDWEGFKELVEKSDIQDKELILRVLSMYSDPMVREREIKNMSSVFNVLAKKILPELRRARYIANIDYANYTDDELTNLVKENVEILDNEALLYAATLINDIQVKISLYKKAAEKYNCSRAYNNLAAAYLYVGNLKDAKVALSKVSDKNCYYYNNMGVVALREKDMAVAVADFAKSKLPQAKYNSAIIDILNGKYDVAATKLSGAGGDAEGLAYILTEQYDKAAKAFTCGCAYTSYLKAVLAARQGDAAKVEAELAKATKVEAFKLRAENDIEFAKFRN